ncbi:hypothetical protein FPV67DRAFT_787109 [Lyophyllum atratum]|nr:hypothetical protein FPV67DRAFT_787109 [Lyophyllum atratum]
MCIFFLSFLFVAAARTALYRILKLYPRHLPRPPAQGRPHSPAPSISHAYGFSSDFIPPLLRLLRTTAAEVSMTSCHIQYQPSIIEAATRSSMSSMAACVARASFLPSPGLSMLRRYSTSLIMLPLIDVGHTAQPASFVPIYMV